VSGPRPAPEDRADRLAKGVAGLGLDALIVGDLVNPGDSGREAMADITWLTGFGGSSALVAIGPEIRAFLTDFRYAEKARELLPESWDLVEVSAKMIPKLAGLLSGTVGIDETQTSVETHRKLLDDVGEGVELTAAEGLVEGLRRVKDEREIEAIAAATALADEVFGFLEERGLAGRTEREVALAAEARMRELGAENPSFASIVAAAANGASPHAVPSEREIGSGEYVVVDMGAILDGYCSDGTRTLVDGDPDPGQREVYELVLAAQSAGLDAVRAGQPGRDVDAVAREVIKEAGYGEQFGHGLGHGVGIEVHESPRVSKSSEDELMAGDVISIEPGVYIPGEFGVRIEDLVLVTEDGHRNFSSYPK